MTDFLRQGSLVYYTLPNAREVGLAERQVGMVLGRTGMGIGKSESILICPLFYSPSQHAELDTPFELRSGRQLFFRPDLASSVVKKSVELYDHQRGIVCPQSLVETLKSKFLEIITPTPAKTFQHSENGFLRYGEHGWFNDLKNANGYTASRVTALCLTPPSIYKITGSALVLPGHTHLERYYPPGHVAIAPRNFMPFFYDANDVVLTATELCSRSPRDPRAKINDQALRGIAKKTKGTIDDLVFDEILNKYPPLRGIAYMPNHVQQAIKTTHSRNGGSFGIHA